MLRTVGPPAAVAVRLLRRRGGLAAGGVPPGVAANVDRPSTRRPRDLQLGEETHSRDGLWGAGPCGREVWWTCTLELATVVVRFAPGEMHMPYEYFQGTPGAAAQRLRRQVDALSDCRGPHVFDAEDVRLVLEYLETNERARLAEHEAYNRLCED